MSKKPLFFRKTLLALEGERFVQVLLPEPISFLGKEFFLTHPLASIKIIFWQNPRDNVGKIVFQNFCQADFIIGQFSWELFGPCGSFVECKTGFDPNFAKPSSRHRVDQFGSKWICK